MTTPPADATPAIAALASACLQQVPQSPSTFEQDAAAFHATFAALLAAVTATHPRYAFDRENRPPAIDAVRGALPALEAELFDVILEDVACELAATREALYQLVLAGRTRG